MGLALDVSVLQIAVCWQALKHLQGLKKQNPGLEHVRYMEKMEKNVKGEIFAVKAQLSYADAKAWGEKLCQALKAGGEE